MLGRRNHYDLVVIGGGRSGYRAALCARREGAKTALVEKNKLGGHEPASGRALIAHLQDYIAEQPSPPDYSTTRTWLQNDQKRIAQTYTKENLEAEHIDTFFAAATFYTSWFRFTKPMKYITVAIIMAFFTCIIAFPIIYF